MTVTVFKLGDKDYLAKLNKMSERAGDVQQAKADAEKALADALQVLGATEQVRDVDIVALLNQMMGLRNVTNAIAVSDIAGMDVDFNSAKVKGEVVALAINVTNLESTTNNNLANAIDDAETLAITMGIIF